MIGICLPTLDLLRDEAVPKREPAPIAVKLKAWREKNNLSQRQAAAVLQRYGCPVSATTIRTWETGWRVPRELMEKALGEIISAHPIITDAPRYGRWVKDE